jgi:hypothetical protein
MHMQTLQKTKGTAGARIVESGLGVTQSNMHTGKWEHTHQTNQLPMGGTTIAEHGATIKLVKCKQR